GEEDEEVNIEIGNKAGDLLNYATIPNPTAARLLPLAPSQINIDQYDEDKILDEELYDADPRDPATVLADAQSKTSGVRGLLAKGDITGALNSVLENPPYGPKVDDAKILTLQTVLSILTSTKQPDIPAIVKSLPSESQDTLMKYLYKAMAMPGYADVNYGALLTWHEKVPCNRNNLHCIWVFIYNATNLQGQDYEFRLGMGSQGYSRVLLITIP
ncbi:6291_t:CDS:2, partial [Acaulospora colombiana]